MSLLVRHSSAAETNSHVITQGCIWCSGVGGTVVAGTTETEANP